MRVEERAQGADPLVREIKRLDEYGVPWFE
jgi:hypothetical protein